MTKIHIDEISIFSILASLVDGQAILAQKGETSITVVVISARKDSLKRLVFTVVDLTSKKKFQGTYNPKGFYLELIRCY